MCILAGCDFNDRMEKVGMVTAHSILNSYESIKDAQLATDAQGSIIHVKLTKKTVKLVFDSSVLNLDVCYEKFSMKKVEIHIEPLNVLTHLSKFNTTPVSIQVINKIRFLWLNLISLSN
jgi:5'-3' exonuclease